MPVTFVFFFYLSAVLPLVDAPVAEAFQFLFHPLEAVLLLLGLLFRSLRTATLGQRNVDTRILSHLKDCCHLDVATPCPQAVVELLVALFAPIARILSADDVVKLAGLFAKRSTAKRQLNPILVLSRNVNTALVDATRHELKMLEVAVTVFLKHN